MDGTIPIARPVHRTPTARPYSAALGGDGEAHQGRHTSLAPYPLSITASPSGGL